MSKTEKNKIFNKSLLSLEFFFKGFYGRKSTHASTYSISFIEKSTASNNKILN